jgi:LCP family protein required for cell wall assembly
MSDTSAPRDQDPGQPENTDDRPGPGGRGRPPETGQAPPSAGWQRPVRRQWPVRRWRPVRWQWPVRRWRRPSRAALSAGRGHGRRAGRRRRGVRIALICLVSLLVAGAGAVGALAFVANHLVGNIRHIPNAFKGLNNANQPVMPVATRKSMTILVAGSDIWTSRRTTGIGAHKLPLRPGEQRSDSLMLVHINANRKQAAVISIPRDSWVNIPGHGMAKINAAFSYGGPSLAIRAVEQLTHVRINHYAVIDRMGFENMVGALGGVPVKVARATTTGNVSFHRGVNNLTAATAFAYVHQRYGLPLGDLNRIQRQQNLIRAILAKVATEHLVTNPIEMYRFLNAFTHSFSVDSTFSTSAMTELAIQMGSLRGRDITFLTAPWRGFGVQGGQDVVYLNQGQDAGLWRAVRNDTVAAWAARHPASVTPQMPY